MFMEGRDPAKPIHPTAFPGGLWHPHSPSTAGMLLGSLGW